MFLNLIQFITHTFQDFFFFFGYIQNSNSFPQPLSPEEEQKYIEEYNKGSEDAKNILVERNLRLVAHIVKKYSSTGKDTDDLISIGTIGLIKAILTFDSNKNIRLGTYASRCIENEILMYLRSSKKTKVEISLDESIGEDQEGNEICLIDIIGTDTDTIVDAIHNKEQITKLYAEVEKCLTSREKTIIQMRYGLNNTKNLPQREVAQILGISRSYVSRIEKKALGKLNKNMKN